VFDAYANSQKQLVQAVHDAVLDAGPPWRGDQKAPTFLDQGNLASVYPGRGQDRLTSLATVRSQT
jgi:hypothetical protein